MDEIDQRYFLQPLIPWMKIGSIKKAKYKHVWKVPQDAFYWVDISRAQKMSLKSYQTTSNAIILYDTPPPVYIESVVSRKNHENLYARISKSSRPAHTITPNTDWRTNLDPNAEASASSSQLASTEKPVTSKSSTVLDQQKEREVKNEDEENDQSSTGKPVTMKKRTLLDRRKEQEVKNEGEDIGQAKASTGKPCTINSGVLDFRIQGLPHSKVEQAEKGRVRQLVDKNVRYPHKEELQADVRQDNVYNPFSENSKKMIHESGNIECFELCETDSRVQCSYCLSDWTQGILYRTRGLV